MHHIFGSHEFASENPVTSSTEFRKFRGKAISRWDTHEYSPINDQNLAFFGFNPTPFSLQSDAVCDSLPRVCENFALK